MTGPVRSALRAGLVAGLRAYLGFALRTKRWTIALSPQSQDWLTGREGRVAVVAFWHEMLPLSPALWWWAEPHNPALRLRVLISRNQDGRLIADVVAPWRIWSIAGSSDTRGKNKGGANALRQMRRSLRHGCLVAITPDGPRGPRRKVQQGVLALARLAGAPVVPVGAVCHGLKLKTWDRMVLPLPFGRGVLSCGDPLFLDSLPDGADPALVLEQALNGAMGSAERLRATPMDTENPPKALAPLALTPSRIWSVAGRVLTPLLPLFLRWRLARGKELPERVCEKMGHASRSRPDGALVWFHAASVGEVISLLPLVQKCLALRADMHVLLTTGTVTAAHTVSQRLADARVIHQFMPLDVPRWGRRFLRHWQPQAVVFTESELWPTMIGLCHARNIAVALVNGRMSDRSFKRWQRMPGVARAMLERFAWICPRSPEDAGRLSALGASSVLPSGDLKRAARPLPVDQAELERLRASLGARPVWLAASTHAGEEQAIINVARILSRDIPDLLTIIVPRHPERGADIAAMAGGVPRRQLGQLPQPQDKIWVADTLGELGLFFRLASCVFMGNSLPGCKGGGHNPYEPARLGCAIATGPLTGNFTEAYQHFGDAVANVPDTQALAGWVRRVVGNQALREQMGHAAQEIAMADQSLVDQLAERVVALAWSC
ncbi:MAG: glycosyltransferase N-terminal domain-containing protein [Acetobacter papayae]